MKTNVLLAGLLLFSGAAQRTFADDFGTWVEAEVQKKLPSRSTLSMTIGLRTMDSNQLMDRWSGDVSFAQKLGDNLKAEVGYTFLYTYTPRETVSKLEEKRWTKTTDPFWRIKHRGHISLTASVTSECLTFSLRERYQHTYQSSVVVDRWKQQFNYDGTVYLPVGAPTLDPDQKAAKTKQYLRSRVQIEYSKKNLAFSPYVSMELSNNLANVGMLDKTRFCIGTDYKISKGQHLAIGYAYQRGHDDDTDDNIHVVDISYKLKF